MSANTLANQCPLVSVICITYKKFNYVFKALGSILVQDYPNIELIIADDGSPDFPYDDISSYISENKGNNIKDIRILHSKTNQGTVKNLNNAYKNAKGIYLIQLAGDDEFYSSNVVTQIVNTFLENDYDFFLTSRVCIDENDKIIKTTPSKYERKLISKLNTKEKQYKAAALGEFCDVLSGSITYFKKSFINEWGYYDEKYYLLEDIPLYLKYLMKHCINFNFDIISIKYRNNGVSDKKNPNPIFVNDTKLFHKTDLLKCVNDYGPFFYKKIKYTIDRYYMKDLKSRLKLYIKHPLIFLTNVIYQTKTKLISRLLK